MVDATLRSGKCPKCSSNEVYTDNKATKRGERMIIPVSSWTRIFLDSYICISCGYVEEWIPESRLKDENLISKIKDNWEKVK